MMVHAQQSKLSFEGVYILDNPPAVLILKSVADGFSGYISDGENAYKVAGEMNSDYLRLIMVDSPDKLPNYLALDEQGNLMLTDDQSQVICFTRSTEPVDKLILEIEMQLHIISTEVKVKMDVQGINIPVVKNMGKYANKKFLHLYSENGLSEKWAYYLYDHGGFYFKSSNSYMSNNAYSDFSKVSSSSDAGKWKVEAIAGVDYLVLSWNTGEKLSLQIQKAELGYLLDGVKYYLVELEEYE